MIVELYKTNSDNITVDKSIILVATVSGELKYNTSLMNPTINIETSIDDFNYCYIQEFKRYYYVSDISYSGSSGNIKTISLKEDVLMTWKDYIRESEGVIERNENQYNLYIPDNELPTSAKPRKQTINFPNSFSGNKYAVLVVVSGIEIQPETPAPATE